MKVTKGKEREKIKAIIPREKGHQVNFLMVIREKSTLKKTITRPYKGHQMKSLMGLGRRKKAIIPRPSELSNENVGYEARSGENINIKRKR